ncbi:MAG: hypothetical protein GX760_00430 [Erysipelothrix sp.]|nr:hypothetical protein [Erysipelothrix sp.]
MNIKKLSKQVLLIIVGQLFISLCVSMQIVVNLGLDPLGVFNSGIANIFNTTYGMGTFYANVVAFILIIILDKRYINLATLLSLFVVSGTTGFIVPLLQQLFGSDPSLFVRIILLVSSCFILAFGYVIYVGADRGVAPLDAFAELITDKYSYDYKVVKIVADSTYVILGFLLGGSVGVATIIITILVGPIIGWFKKTISPSITDFVEH